MPIRPPITLSTSPSAEAGEDGEEEGSEDCAIPTCLDAPRLLRFYVGIFGPAELHLDLHGPEGEKRSKEKGKERGSEEKERARDREGTQESKGHAPFLYILPVPWRVRSMPRFCWRYSTIAKRRTTSTISPEPVGSVLEIF